MPKRVLARNIDEQIIKATIAVGAKEGVKKCAARKIAALIGIDHAVVIRHFGNTRKLIDAAAIHIDTTGMAMMDTLVQKGCDKIALFDVMLDNFVANADSTLYYNSYINAFGFDPTTHNARSQEFLKYAKIYFGEKEGVSDLKYLMLWDYVTTMAFYYAEKIIKGYVDNDPETRAIIRDIVFCGIGNV